MPENHPDPQLLERFMRGAADGAECRRIVRHLLAGCARCVGVTRPLWELGEERPETPAASRDPLEEAERRLDLPDEEREPAAVACALHRLALLLADGGRGEPALLALRRARRLYDRLGDVPNLVRLRHLEGKIGEALGAPDEAEAAFLDARKGFLSAGLGGEAAAVLLDLAMFYTREGRSAELRPLAEDLLPILRTRDLRQGVAAALLFFRRLVETGEASLEVLSEIARYVKDSPGH